MVENNIKNETEFFAIADEQKKAGKKISLNKSIKWLTWKYLEDGVCKQKGFLLKRNWEWLNHSHKKRKDSLETRAETAGFFYNLSSENY